MVDVRRAGPGDAEELMRLRAVMLLQSLLSLVIAALVVARAVNALA